jgi:4-oxalmesaconate hydratase
MIIDIHAHFTAPEALYAYKANLLASRGWGRGRLKLSDDAIVAALNQPVHGGTSHLQQLEEVGTDMQIISPRPYQLMHSEKPEIVVRRYAEACNDLTARQCQLFPKKFLGMASLPQSMDVSPKAWVEELERCVKEYGFIGCNLNPDPSGGYWTDPPLTDRWWYPIYEKMVELDVPAMIHVSSSCNPNFHATGAHYINADTTAVMQFITSDIFKTFPTLKLIIPHGGGAVPYHWGRYRGLAQDMKRPPFSELLLKNVFFDTCVYHQPGIDLLTKVVPVENILFASEMVGAVRGIDPETGNYFDDTKRYIDSAQTLDPAQRKQIFEGNARRVFSRLDKHLAAAGVAR